MAEGYGCHQDPSDQQWLNLFDLAREFRSLAPWHHRTCRPLFGISIPNSSEVAYVCTVGFDAHRPGMIALSGAAGFYSCRDGSDHQWEDPLGMMYSARSLKVVYMDRDQLRKEERKLIKRLNLKFRNRFNWPAFRSFIPGFVTWHFDALEAAKMEIILEQTCAMLREVPEIADMPASQDTVLIRSLAVDSGDSCWLTKREPIPEIPGCMDGVDPCPDTIAGLNQLPKTENILSINTYVSNDMLHDDVGRPYYPLCMVLADEETGFSIHSALLGGTDDMSVIAEKSARFFVDGLKRFKACPQKVVIQSSTLSNILSPITDSLQVVQSREIKHESGPERAWDSIENTIVM